MNCKDVSQWLDAYADKEIALERSLEVEKHLQTCPDCTALHQEILALRAILKTHASSLTFQSPARLRPGLISKKTQASDFSRFLFRPAYGLMAAVFICVFAWAIDYRVLSPSNEELLIREVVSSHVRSLMVNHLSDVASTDQHTVKPWFDGRLDYSPLVKDFSEHDFKLTGGRLDYLNKRPVAALVYKRRQHIINLFSWPSVQSGAAKPKFIVDRGFQVYHWRRGEMEYWAVSDLNGGELQEFVSYLQTP